MLRVSWSAHSSKELTSQLWWTINHANVYVGFQVQPALMGLSMYGNYKQPFIKHSSFYICKWPYYFWIVSLYPSTCWCVDLKHVLSHIDLQHVAMIIMYVLIACRLLFNLTLLVAASWPQHDCMKWHRLRDGLDTLRWPTSQHPSMSDSGSNLISFSSDSGSDSANEAQCRPVVPPSSGASIEHYQQVCSCFCSYHIF